MDIMITDTNFDIVARNAYTNPGCVDHSEYVEDYNRFKYLRRLLRRYKDKDELKLKLILNHVIILYNVFQPSETCTRLILHKLHEFRPEIKPFIVLLNFWKEGRIVGVDGVNYGSDIPLNQHVVAALRAEFPRGK